MADRQEIHKQGFQDPEVNHKTGVDSGKGIL
jgi:hypothetical protein